MNAFTPPRCMFPDLRAAVDAFLATRPVFTPALPSDLASHPLPPGFAVHSDVSDRALTFPAMPWLMGGHS